MLLDVLQGRTVSMAKLLLRKTATHAFKILGCLVLVAGIMPVHDSLSKLALLGDLVSELHCSAHEEQVCLGAEVLRVDVRRSVWVGAVDVNAVGARGSAKGDAARNPTKFTHCPRLQGCCSADRSEKYCLPSSGAAPAEKKAGAPICSMAGTVLSSS